MPNNLPERPKAIRDQLILEAFAMEFDYCWACGLPERRVWEGDLQIHHWAGGRYGRPDQRWNLCRLCNMCHQLAGSYTHRQPNGLVVPALTRGACLYLKRMHDPKFWKPRQLVLVTRQALPDLERPAAYYTDQYEKNRHWEFR